MFVQVLVDEQIEAGRAVLDALRRDHVKIFDAFWCRVPESGYWRLVIASKLIDQIGSLEGYRRLRVILDRLGLWSALSGSISFLSPSDPTFQSLREYAHGPGQFRQQASYGIPYNPFQDAYFYSPVKV